MSVVYKGITFIQELEARWSAFFDAMGEEWLYFSNPDKSPHSWFHLPRLKCLITSQWETPERCLYDAIKNMVQEKQMTAFMMIGPVAPFEMIHVGGDSETPSDLYFSWSKGISFAMSGDVDGSIKFGMCPKCDKMTIGEWGRPYWGMGEKDYKDAPCRDHWPEKYFTPHTMDEERPKLREAYKAAKFFSTIGFLSA